MVAICLDFKWLGFRFQISFKIPTICKPISFWPVEIQTSPCFRSLVYLGLEPTLFQYKTLIEVKTVSMVNLSPTNVSNVLNYLNPMDMLDIQMFTDLHLTINVTVGLDFR